MTNRKMFAALLVCFALVASSCGGNTDADAPVDDEVIFPTTDEPDGSDLEATTVPPEATSSSVEETTTTTPRPEEEGFVPGFDPDTGEPFPEGSDPVTGEILDE